MKRMRAPPRVSRAPVAGGAVWELVPPEDGENDPRVRARVQFPDVDLTMTMVMERNLDPTLPASHTVLITFETDGRESRNVRDIGLLQLKEEEVVRGAPIAGLPVPIDDNHFLIGLSNVASDVQRNRNLLSERNWIDIPIRFFRRPARDHQLREGIFRRSGHYPGLCGLGLSLPVCSGRYDLRDTTVPDDARSVRSMLRLLDRSEVVPHRLLNLLEGTNLDLAHPLA